MNQMKSSKKNKNYFETVYLGKNSGNMLTENKKLQKLLSLKALNSSVDSRPLRTNDLKKISRNKICSSSLTAIDFDNYIFPYECI